MLNNAFRKNLLPLLLVMGALISSGYALTTKAAGNVTDCSTYGDAAGTLGAALAGGGLVTFQCSGTIIVPEIRIELDTAIDASGQSVTLSGNNANTVFLVNPRRSLELINLTITDGFSAGSGGGIRNLGGTVSLTSTIVSGNNATSFGGRIENRNWVDSEGTAEGTMSLTNGTVSGNSADNFGGGIFNAGTMTLTDSTVSSNSAPSAGGIHNVAGTNQIGIMTLTNSTVSDNTAGNNRGGIFNDSGELTLINSAVLRNSISGNPPDPNGNAGGIENFVGTLTIINSTLSGNSAPRYAGGINTYGGTITLTDSALSDNHAGTLGGGIANSGALTIINSTLSGNSAGTLGGGIRNVTGPFDTGQITLTNSTLSNNSADSQGGGISNAAPLTLTNTTLSNNTAAAGGGLYVSNHPAAPITLFNTIIANSPVGGDCGGDTEYIANLTDSGYNLDSDATCNLTASNKSLPNTDPRLNALADNGGPTQTHALLGGSPAIDRIPPDSNGCGTTITTDQRGVARPQGGGCDIGAYESEAAADTQPPIVSEVTADPNLTSPFKVS